MPSTGCTARPTTAPKDPSARVRTLVTVSSAARRDLRAAPGFSLPQADASGDCVIGGCRPVSTSSSAILRRKKMWTF